MKIRRFYGSNIRIALKQVTEEFGPDAAILSNKKVAGGVEVIAALDYDDSLVPPDLESKSPSQASSTRVQAKPERRSEMVTAEQENQTKAQAPFKSEVTRERPALKNDSVSPAMGSQIGHFNDEGISGEGVNKDVVTSILPKEQLEWTLDPSLQAMKEELGLMRSMMSEQLKGIGWHQFADRNPLAAMIMRRLTKLGLDSEFLNSVLPHVKQQTDAECAWQQVLAIIAKSLPVVNGEPMENGGVFAFMGPAGVGKTTTIAKLAARYVIKHGTASVALITTDNYRISAQEQLSTFGRILQIPAAKVTEHQSLASLLKKFADKKLILIDTAGMSSADQALVKQLEMIKTCGRPVHKFLLMSASSQGAVLQQSLNLFSAYQPDGIIVTKLDEAASLGDVLSVVTKAHIPVAYTSDGQRIPEDIRMARSHHLVSKAVWLANKYTKNADDWTLAQTIEQVKTA